MTTTMMMTMTMDDGDALAPAPAAPAAGAIFRAYVWSRFYNRSTRDCVTVCVYAGTRARGGQGSGAGAETGARLIGCGSCRSSCAAACCQYWQWP